MRQVDREKDRGGSHANSIRPDSIGIDAIGTPA
jgi:hypothetical protein